MTGLSRPAHGGHPGEVIYADEYLGCMVCSMAFPLDAGDEECFRCGGEFAVMRINPAPESTMRMV